MNLHIDMKDEEPGRRHAIRVNVRQLLGEPTREVRLTFNELGTRSSPLCIVLDEENAGNLLRKLQQAMHGILCQNVETALEKKGGAK